jgi:cell division septation protein DedD
MIHARPRAAASPVLAVALLALLGLAGCARDGSDWAAAQEADTPEAYDDFVTRHPQSEFAAKAKERSAQKIEERDWAAATQSDSPEAYQKFVGRHPDGKWTQEARIRIENFNVMAASAPEVAPAPAPASATPPGAVAAAPGPALRPSAAAPPKPVTTVASAAAAAPAAAAASTPASAGHRVQLGAFSTVGKAEAEWSRLRARFAPLQALEPRIGAVQTAAGRLFRLQAGLPGEAEAKALCDTLKAGGQACLYVPPTK